MPLTGIHYVRSCAGPSGHYRLHESVMLGEIGGRGGGEWVGVFPRWVVQDVAVHPIGETPFPAVNVLIAVRELWHGYVACQARLGAKASADGLERM